MVGTRWISEKKWYAGRLLTTLLLVDDNERHKKVWWAQHVTVHPAISLCMSSSSASHITYMDLLGYFYRSDDCWLCAPLGVYLCHWSAIRDGGSKTTSCWPRVSTVWQCLHPVALELRHFLVFRLQFWSFGSNVMAKVRDQADAS